MNQNKITLVKNAVHSLRGSLRHCTICPRKCGVDRTRGELGYCRASNTPRVYSYLAHQGEEPPISGTKGSGTIFFSHCNMKCLYCQNYYFSQLDKGKEITIEKLSDIMLGLQGEGCHNINLVTPTHYLPQILAALEIAFEKGLNIPIVYNTSGYELTESIKLLKGIVDIYLPDMRYSDNEMARIYSGAISYVEYNRAAVKEMYIQAGSLVVDDRAIAIRGMIIRLLTLPNKISGTEDTLRFISKEIGCGACLSVMNQYYPTFKAVGFSDVSRGILPEEYKNVVDEAHLLGLNRGWIQEEPEKTDPKFYGTNIKEKEGI